jgi:hypothetical protein
MNPVLFTASLTVLGLIALFAPEDDTAQQQSSMQPEAYPPSIQAADPGSRLHTELAASGCAPTDEDVWFAPLPRLVECVSNTYQGVELLTAQRWRVADVNGDGAIDHLRTLQGFGGAQSWYAFFLGSPSAELSNAAIMLETVDQQTQQLRLTKISLFMSASDVQAWTAENFPSVPNGGIQFSLGYWDWSGWRDMDGDGDLDLLLVVLAIGNPSGSEWTRQVWLENIGYERPAPPLAADLNRDGYVNGLDLGLLLGQWGPNP